MPLSIADLDLLLELLPDEEREIFYRIFRIRKMVGCMEHPPMMHPWLQKQFGSLEGVTCQQVVKITNIVTYEGALFNRLRASRPLEHKNHLDITASILDEGIFDPLKDPENTTPEDLFGRVKGKYCITASNVAKYDALHSLIVFKSFNPLDFDREKIYDYIDTAWRWAQTAREHHPEAKYFLLIWNCLWRAGASLHHGHAQVMLTEGEHYARIEGLRRAAVEYRQKYGTNYFDDLYFAHAMVRAGFEKDGVRVMAYLTPIKEKEVMLLGPALDDSFKDRLYEVLSCFRDQLHVVSFNLMLVTPPLDEVEEDWRDFPVLARIVDRGDLRVTVSDFGTMELYAASVISSDPLKLARVLRESLYEARNNPPGIQ